MSYTVKIGTRKSDLALTQTGMVAEQLSKFQIPSDIHQIVTTGDRDLRPFPNIAGDGFFTKEIERNLLKKVIDIAVHSAKDLPSQTHKDLPWVTFSHREDTSDVLIISKENLASEFPLKIKDGIVIGTSSPRRLQQLKKLFLTAQIKPIRGNVPTRIEKVLKNEVQATVLAYAGIKRLRLEKSISGQNLKLIVLPFVTAPCQGILAVQGLAAHRDILLKLQNEELNEIARAEKRILALLGGGCQLAVGAQIDKTVFGFELKFYYHDGKKEFSFEMQNQNLSELLRDLFVKISGAEQKSPRVILAQSLQHQLRSAQKFIAHGFQVLPWSPEEILPTWNMNDFETIKNDFKSFDALIFTSQFAVRIFMNDWISLFPDLLSELKRKTIYSVGKSTTAELAAYDVTNVREPTENHGEALLRTVTEEHPLFIGSEDAIFLKLLRHSGRNYKFLPLYRSFKAHGPLSDLPPVQDNDRVLITSPKLAENFAESLQRQNSSKRIHVYAFGPSTSRRLHELQIPHEVNPQSGNWDQLIDLMQPK